MKVNESQFKEEIGEATGYSFDWDYLDLLAGVVDDCLNDDFDLDFEIERATTYSADIWKIAKHHYAIPIDISFNDLTDALREDAENVIAKIKEARK